MKIKHLALIATLSITGATQASLFTPFTKIAQKLSKKGTQQRVSPSRAIKDFTRGQTENNQLINYKVKANDGEFKDSEILVNIDDKLIESDLRNMDLIETLEEYLPTNDRFKADYATKKIFSAIQLNIHNHLVLKEMDSGEKAAYTQTHKDNVDTLLMHLQLKIGRVSGPGAFIDDLKNHINALRQVHFDMNNL